MITRKANASPTKSFFVRMLTRDISLDDCILDLVDNSVDGAWNESGANPSHLISDDALSNYRVEIEISQQEFSISDNCGGISLDDAADYAFTFGRRQEQEPNAYAVGVYGIGMKRAVFKLGRDIMITSTYRDGERLNAFLVPIEVEKWLSSEDGPWDFDLDEHQPAEQPGVQIIVRNLTSETASKFSDPTYPRNLQKVLSRDYMIPLMRGLTVTINGLQVHGWKLELKWNDSFRPMRSSYIDDGVRVEIVAGTTGAPPASLDPEETTRDSSDRYGWYVLCNGRVVVAADKSPLTGWGVGVPKWHPQYNGFVGVLMFSAPNPGLLPMTTTKRSVDSSSPIYVRALARLQAPVRAWTDYTNDRKQDIETAASREQDLGLIDLTEIEERHQLQVPTLIRRSSRERLANVNYSVPLRRMQALAAGMGDTRMSYREVGIRSFDLAYDELAEDPNS